MERNVGSIDSAVRAMVGLGLLMTAAALSSVWIASAALIAVSLVLLYTALTERCPAYRVFGWNTRREPPPPVRPEPHRRA
jgi:hypothetical protein